MERAYPSSHYTFVTFNESISGGYSYPNIIVNSQRETPIYKIDIETT